MLNIRVNTSVILEKLQTNLQLHNKAHEEALVGFRDMATEWFAEQLGNAKNGREFVAYNHKLTTKPRSYAASYERAIGLLRMSQEPTVVLTEQDYAKYVQDDWEWKEEFRTTNSSYSK